MAKVSCPTCGREVKWDERQNFRPFCSERCKMIDLGTWASNGYSITGKDDSDVGGGEANGSENKASKASSRRSH
ncbi:MAG TPA: DNA gyrase inhibitor YacG [Burkholderiaceae bacterium]|nr:DNA gyrase inhibitor YacG [Burkholderiaceae bacterium]